MDRRKIVKIIGISSFGIVSGGYKMLLLNEKMNFKLIPSTGEQIPVIGLGTWQTFDVDNIAEQTNPLSEVLKLLIEKGGKVIDSSPMYGRSEEVVGTLLKKNNISSSFLATKVWTTGKEEGIKQMQNSFKLLQTGIVDLMQIHNLVDWKTHIATLRSWKESGKIRYIGITHYHNGAYDQIEKILHNEKLDFLQINYSIRQREAEKRILPLAQEKGIAVLINQPFESGRLFSYTKNKEVPEFAKESGCNSWGQYFLKFIISNPAVSCVIPGTSKPKHLLDNMLAGYGLIPDNATRIKMIKSF